MFGVSFFWNTVYDISAMRSSNEAFMYRTLRIPAALARGSRPVIAPDIESSTRTKRNQSHAAGVLGCAHSAARLLPYSVMTP